jgi:hypothetical protein
MVATVIIASQAERQKAALWVSKAPLNSRVTFKGPKRTIPQNDRLWAMLTDVAVQLPWHGVKLTPEDWKLLFLDALKHELRLAPNLNGNGFVNLGRSSSTLSKQEFSDLLALVEAFGVEHGVTFADGTTP